jgi:hypothetical protein
LGLVAQFFSAANAASINYGNFNVPSPPTSVMFLGVTESSGTDAVPLYGPPTPTVVPVGLDFDPQSFVASSAGGGADLTDGQLNFTVMGNLQQQGNKIVGNGISAISLNEAGDISLGGFGTAATQVFAGAILTAKITAIDGNPIAPITLTPVNASINKNLIANPGFAQPWSLGLTVDIQGALNLLSVPYQIGATKVEVFLNNTLAAISEPTSVALIAKKDFGISIIPDPGDFDIPEPSTAIMAFVALVGLAGARVRS